MGSYACLVFHAVEEFAGDIAEDARDGAPRNRGAVVRAVVLQKRRDGLLPILRGTFGTIWAFAVGHGDEGVPEGALVRP